MKKTIRYILVIIVATLTAGIFAGCTNYELQTIVIKPDSKRFWYANRGIGQGYKILPCLNTDGQSCDPGLDADDSTIVGYSHSYHKYGVGDTCWSYVNCAYRGYVGFNILSLKDTGFVTAKLKWQPSTQRSIGDTATNTGGCIAKMYFATEPWKKDAPTAGETLSWTFLGESSEAPSEKDVSQVVRTWLNGTQPNYGFFFVGSNENVNEKNNNKCLTTMTDMHLEVIISVPK